jgi:hypothetical protein
MSRWRRIVAGCVGLLALGAGVDGQVLYAQDPVEEKRPRVELGLGAWISSGETKWAHDASSIPGLGNPTSKLTYKDVGTNVIDLVGKFWFTPRVFGRLNVGVGDIGGGRLIDDDFASGQRLISSTTSDIQGNNMWYLNADLGGRVKEFPNHRGYLEVFAGYQFWHTEHRAVGVGRLVCDSTVFNCTAPLPPPGQTVITNTTNWHSIRVGGSTEYRITRRFSVLGTVAVSPISIVDNKDIHHLRPDLKQNPSLSMVGYGFGADADVGARLMIVKNFYLNVGYRVWWNRTIDGHVTFHDAGGFSDEFPLAEFQSLRHGLTFGLNYAF